MTAPQQEDGSTGRQKKKTDASDNVSWTTPAGSFWATVYWHSEVKELGAKIAEERGGGNEGGEKQISATLSLGADLQTDGHNKGGGNIPEADTSQPYWGAGTQGKACRQRKTALFFLDLGFGV